MSQTLTQQAPAKTDTPPAPAADKPQRGRGVWLERLLILPRFAVGVLLCQTVLTTLLVVGWTQRWLQRRVLVAWWRRSPYRSQGGGFDEFLAELPQPVVRRSLPNWLGSETGSRHGNRSNTRLARWFGALKASFTRGAAASANAFLWLLPATALWYYAWVLGWNISFHKLYEQSHLGASLGIAGVLLFAGLMLYLPVALARQALTRDPRRFYDLKINWRLARSSAWSLVPLASVVAAVGFVVMVLRIAPYFIGGQDHIAAMSPAEQLEWLKGYYLFASIFVLAGYLLTWLLAARVYASAALAEHRYGNRPEALDPFERQALESLGYHAEPRPAERHPLVVGGVRLAGRGWSTVGLATASLLWVAVAFEVFVGQFFHYVPGLGWLNHPLLVLPWVRYLPPGLVD